MLGEHKSTSSGLTLTIAVQELSVQCTKGLYIFQIRPGATSLDVDEMREFLGTISGAFHMLEDVPAENDMPMSPSEVPIREEGPCGECDSSSGITAKGKYRQCTNCGYMWRVP